jgi:hypothetical protein
MIVTIAITAMIVTIAKSVIMVRIVTLAITAMIARIARAVVIAENAMAVNIVIIATVLLMQNTASITNSIQSRNILKN